MIAIIVAFSALVIPPPDRDLGPPKGPSPFTAKVVGVSDGDTLTVLTAEKRQVKIRLNRIDAPESKQDFGQKSKQFTSDQCFGEQVTIHPRDIDRYGRTVAEVELADGRNLNRELVREGYAWWFRKYAPKDTELERLEAEARAAKRGLWIDPNAISPWDYRVAGDPKYANLVLANKKSMIYHKPGCPNGQKIAEKNRVEFADEAGAERAGYRPGGDCHKGQPGTAKGE